MEEDEVSKKFVNKVEEFKDKPKASLVESEVVNIRGYETIKETHVSIHLTKDERDEYTWICVKEPRSICLPYADMIGLSTAKLTDGLPSDPSCPLIKHKLTKYKLDLRSEIKEENSKKIVVGIL